MATIEYGVPELTAKIDWYSRQLSHDVDKREQMSFSKVENAVTMQDGKYYYGVQIVTGEQVGAGTRASAYVMLIGEKGKTGKLSLRGWLDFLNPISRDTYDDLVVVSDEDLGKVLVVVVGCDSSLFEDEWFVSFVTVANVQLKAVNQFPCYHWIGREKSVSITANTTTKKDVAGSAILLKQRAAQLSKRKQVYKWQSFPYSGLPSGIDDSLNDIPTDEQFGTVKNIDFTTGAIESFATIKVSGFFDNINSLDDFKKFADALGGDSSLYDTGRWKTDADFGWQMLNAVNPIIIRKCESLPPNFPVTNDMVKPILERDITLQQEMEAGNVYICDMKFMDGLKPRENYVNVAPICLLYVNKSKQLVPIAIQLKQGVREEEKTDNPIFLPIDAPNDWLLAKIYYQSAHSQYHQTFTHYTSCHATMEAYSMGTQRNLPDAHPIFKLLVPHFRYTMGINTRARATLINPGGIIDKFFGIGGDGLLEQWRRCGATYNVHTSNIKRWAKERGVDNAEQLPGYYYRDDGIKVWDALEQYASDVIDQYYQIDADVVNDDELQAWAQDIHTDGFPGFQGAPVGHGFPDKMASKEELKMYCTLIMFTGSAQHASVNFMQYTYYKFSPNAPFGVRQLLPGRKGSVTDKVIIETLPEEESVINTVGTVHLLSQYSDNERFLGTLKARFTDERAATTVKKFQDSLQRVSGGIKKRNEGLAVPYSAMLPEKIPNSITI